MKDKIEKEEKNKKSLKTIAKFILIENFIELVSWMLSLEFKRTLLETLYRSDDKNMIL